MNYFFNAVATLFILAFTATAAERYVAVDGTGDGSSADSPMASLADAYAQAAEGATKENPGVVHVASGMYRLATTIALLPNVKVIGGYGGRTVISGDNMSTTARAAFWSKNLIDSSNVVKPGISKTPIWNDDLTYNEPNPDGESAWFCSWYGNSPGNTKRGFENTDSDIGENIFENITFTLFRYGTFKFSSGRLVLKNCTFVGDCCNGLSWTEDVASISAAGSACVDVLSNEFVGCVRAMLLKGSGNSSVINTLFRENCVQNVIEVSGSHRLTSKNCTFSRNWATVANRAVVYLGSSVSENLLEDCLFTTNFSLNGASGAVYLGGDSNRVIRCNFVGNQNMDWSYVYGSVEKLLGPGIAACINLDANKLNDVSDCSFTGNILKYLSQNKSPASIISANSAKVGRSIIYNCNISGNSVVSAADGSASLIHRLNSEIYFIHSSIVGNTYSGEQSVPFRSTYSGSNNPSSVFCNTIFDEKDFNGNPFDFSKPDKGPPSIFASVVKGFDASYFDYTNSSAPINSHFGSAKIAEKSVRISDGRVFHRLSFDSAFRKTGYPVYVDASGIKWCYRPDSGTWMRFDVYSNKDSPSGLILEEKTVLSYDALGAERVYNKVALGPVNAQEPGLFISVR